MHPTLPRLRDQSFLVKIGLLAFLVAIGIGYVAALEHLVTHHGPKDGEEGLQGEDVVAAYHGIDHPAPILKALDDPAHQEIMGPLDPESEEILREWLTLPPGADPASPMVLTALGERYDMPPPGASEDTLVPADVLDESCVRCHSPGATEGTDASKALSLARWPSVQAAVLPRKMDPVPEEILVTSLHTHALAMPVYALLVGLLFLASGFPRWITGGAFALSLLGLPIEFLGMWLARESAVWTQAIWIGGALHGAGLGIALIGSALALFVGPKGRS